MDATEYQQTKEAAMRARGLEYGETCYYVWRTTGEITTETLHDQIFVEGYPRRLSPDYMHKTQRDAEQQAAPFQAAQELRLQQRKAEEEKSAARRRRHREQRQKEIDACFARDPATEEEPWGGHRLRVMDHENFECIDCGGIFFVPDE